MTSEVVEIVFHEQLISLQCYDNVLYQAGQLIKAEVLPGKAMLAGVEIKGPDNPTCQLLPKDNERKVKLQE